ncbi:SAM-dependent methyltransferase [Nocardioides marinisabuli]|uniref:SAM-dependent methyltransferase n=1 Tax=Nocardioides marinisabuli TaxID=419476 RepID=A0A7Y9JT31_9ACTN|nr:class I SAM-dependent methyltransferase [Nocardioides marinisabuli]NYD58389.1 SAM-dependent methyltransferase [Nocardioides marinisabuli]
MGDQRPRTTGPARGLDFGSVASDYERFRLEYPLELVDVVHRYAGRPPRRALEVGAGTGKATRLFAGGATAVTALEPDPDMAALLVERTSGLRVRTLVSTFEAFAADEPFDLVYAAAAWHWTDPASRWARAVRLLAPGGVLALFRRRSVISEPALRAAVDAVEREVLPAADPAALHPWSVADMEAAPGLTDTVQRDLGAVGTVESDAYVGRLATVSAYLLLGPSERAAALSRVREVLPDRLEVDSTLELAMARRL